MENKTIKYKRATKRVKQLKGFYNHIKIFVVVNLALYLIKSGWIHSWLPNGFPRASYYFDWINENFVIWGIFLVFHGLLVFRNKLPFFKNWEKKQIQKFMEQESKEEDKYR